MPETIHRLAFYLEHGRDSGGWRDYIDGQPVYNGSLLMLKRGGEWMLIRYETSDYARHEIRGYQKGGSIPLDRETMRFRRLTEEEREAADREFEEGED